MYSNAYLPDCVTGGTFGGGNDFICREDNANSYWYMQTSISRAGRDRIRAYLEDRDSTVDLDFIYDNPQRMTVEPRPTLSSYRLIWPEALRGSRGAMPVWTTSLRSTLHGV